MTVTVCSKQDDTTALLAKVLDGDRTAASLLAEAIHQKLELHDELAEKLQLHLQPEDLAIWIDPIGIKKSTGCFNITGRKVLKVTSTVN